MAFREIRGKLFPSVGMKKSGEHIRVNFGQSPFIFDIDGMMSVSQSLSLFSYEIIPSLYYDPSRRTLSTLVKAACAFVAIQSPLPDLAVIHHMIMVGGNESNVRLIMLLYIRGREGTAAILPGSERRLFERLRFWRERSIFHLRAYDGNFGQQVPELSQVQNLAGSAPISSRPSMVASSPSTVEAPFNRISMENLPYLRWAAYNPESLPLLGTLARRQRIETIARQLDTQITAMIVRRRDVSLIVDERVRQLLDEEISANNHFFKSEKQRVKLQIESARFVTFYIQQALASYRQFPCPA